MKTFSIKKKIKIYKKTKELLLNQNVEGFCAALTSAIGYQFLIFEDFLKRHFNEIYKFKPDLCKTAYWWDSNSVDKRVEILNDIIYNLQTQLKEKSILYRFINNFL